MAEAQRLHEAGNLVAAEPIYHQLLSKNPGNPNLLYLMGTLFMQRGCNGLAIQLLSDCLKSKPDFGEAWNQLAICLRHEHFNESAESAYEEAQRCMPTNPDIRANRAGGYVNTGRPEKVMEYAEQALRLDPNHVLARWHKALALLEKQRFGEAWPYHEARLDPASNNGTALRNYAKDGMTPWWNGEPGRVVIHGEQGLGDEIMFSSCLPKLKDFDNEFIVECAPRLAALFRRSFPFLRVVGTHHTDGRDWLNGETVDYKCGLGSLPRLLGFNEEQDFTGKPFLVADPQQREFYRYRLAELSERPKVGIAWQGGVQKTAVHLRSIPLDEWLPILRQPATWVSLQYTDAAPGEICAFSARHDIAIHHFVQAARGEDMDEQAALIAELDLVITVCQTAYHVAGGLGVPCWVLTPSQPSWREGVTGDMPWYESVALIRQGKDEPWSQAIGHAAHLLQRTLTNFDAYQRRLPETQSRIA